MEFFLAGGFVRPLFRVNRDEQESMAERFSVFPRNTGGHSGASDLATIVDAVLVFGISALSFCLLSFSEAFPEEGDKKAERFSTVLQCWSVEELLQPRLR